MAPSPWEGGGEGSKGFKIRPATPADFPRIAALASLNRSEPVTVESLTESEARFPANGLRRTLVAEADGEVRAFGRVRRWPHDEPGFRFVDLATESAYRNRGLAGALLDGLTDDGPDDLRTDVRDNEPASVAFAERRGFGIVRHRYESILDLDAVDLDLLWAAIQRAEDGGVRFFSFAETAMDDDAIRRLWSLNVESGQDQPNQTGPPPALDVWTEMVVRQGWFDPEGQIVAAIGDEWVGLGAVGTFSPGCFYNLYTGVRHAHRRRGVATALKALGIRFAQARGGRTLRTNNDAANAPMLAVNRLLGFQPLPGWYTMKKEVPTPPLSPPGERGRG